jgi:sulfur-carrier protein
MMTIKVFGQLTDVIGHDSVELDVRPTVGEMRSLLYEKYPLLASKKFNVAIENKIASDELLLTDHVVICLLPPYSGG